MATNVHGAWSGPKDPTGDTQNICDQLKSQVEKFTGKTYEVFRAVKYRILGEAEEYAENYQLIIKVYVGVEDYIHLSVFQPSPLYGGGVDLHGVEQGRTKDKPLEHFTSPLMLQK